MKKMSAFLLALVMIIGCMTAGSINVAAEEVTSVNPYTYSIQNWTFPSPITVDNYDEIGGVHMWLGCVTSPFWVKVETITGDSSIHEANLFDLYDEVKGHTVEAFCIDVDTRVNNAFYQRINLEDSTYFTEVNAQKIRAIVNNGVTVKSLAEMESAANVWLKANGKPEVIGLKGAEALTATQYAIWCMANAKDIVSAEPYNSYSVQDYRFVQASKRGHLYGSPCTVDGKSEVYKTQCNENPIQYNQAIQYDADGVNISKQNITGVAEYLLSLEPEAAKEVALSDNTIQNPVITYKMEADGTYTAVVDFNLIATMTESTTLTATISAGGKSVSQPVVAAGAQSLTLTGLAAKMDINIEINGQQQVSDVFFFEAEGGRTASQTLVGIDSCLVPVHAATVATTNRVINISKTTVVKEGDQEVLHPLEGIAFDIYYWCTVDEYTANAVAYDAIDWEKADLSSYVTAEDLVATVQTDVKGQIACDVTAKGDGVYLIVEKAHPAIQKALAPFPVAVPMTTGDGAGLTYEVELTPKNDVLPGPDIRKDVTEIKQDLDSFGVGEVHTWIIGTDVPVDMANGKAYVITDTLDYRLTYAGDADVVVKVALKDSNAGTETVTLIEDVDYTLKSTAGVTTVNGVEEAITSFEVALTEAGMDKVVASIASDKTCDKYEVRVYFNAYIDEDAKLGEMIPNQAELKYTNSVNFSFDTKSDIPKVYTCAISIYKHDAANKNIPLDGASFKLARVATQAEIDAGVSASLVVDGNVLNVVYESFYTKAALSTEEVANSKVQVVTTDENGNAVLYGIGAGQYYLVEIKAPAGYNLLTNPISVTLNENATSIVVEVANSNNFVLPDTGGIGTTIFTICGVALIAAAVVVLVIKKKKEDEDEEETEE